ncbi:MAG: FAD-dependent oxidoreductase [Planctomycetota bacterium]|nr:FAD-dependent oxidoreductase [Planctomycetota bacterium]
MRSVTVLGGGIVGLTISRELRRRGIEVELLESRSIGSGATGASTGILTPPQHSRTPFYQLRTLAWKNWPQYAASLAAETGIDVGYRRCGAIDIRERTIRNPQREVKKLRDCGGRVEVLSQDQIRELLPDMVRSPEAGLRVEMEARIDPLATTEALRRSCHGAGVSIRENLGPIRIEPLGEGGISLVASGDIELSQPSEQHKVILAAGWESVSAALAMPPTPLPLDPVPGEAITLDLPAPPHMVHFNLLREGFRDPSGNRSIYSWIPAPDGTSWLGNSVASGHRDGGRTEAWSSAAVEPTAEGRDELVEVARSLFGAGVESRITDHRAGIRPKATRHGGPLLGMWPGRPQLWVATGHYRAGLLLGPATATMVVDSMLDGAPIPEQFQLPR